MARLDFRVFLGRSLPIPRRRVSHPLRVLQRGTAEQMYAANSREGLRRFTTSEMMYHSCLACLEIYRRPAVSSKNRAGAARRRIWRVVEIDEGGSAIGDEGDVRGREDLDAVGVMAVAGAAGQTAGSAGLVGGAVAPGSAAGRCSGRPLGRVRAVRAALPLDDALLGLAGPLRTAVRVRAGGAGRAGVGVRIAVLLLGGPHPGLRIVADHVVARRLRIRG